MSKTKEELNALKEEVETVSRKLHELSDDELELVSGGGAGKNGCEGGVPIWINVMAAAISMEVPCAT